MDNSLENVKVGDKLIVEYSNGLCCIDTVVRITATLVVTAGNRRFRKRTGRTPGDGCFSWSYARPGTAEEIERAREEGRRRALAVKCEKINFKHLSASRLEQILKIANKEI